MQGLYPALVLTDSLGLQAAQAGGKAREQEQPEKARRPEPGSNGAEATRGRKRQERESEGDHAGARLDGDALGRGHADDDRYGSSAGHAALPPRKKALRSVVVSAQ